MIKGGKLQIKQKTIIIKFSVYLGPCMDFQSLYCEVSPCVIFLFPFLVALLPDLICTVIVISETIIMNYITWFLVNVG
jgi:hypothetical protein